MIDTGWSRRAVAHVGTLALALIIFGISPIAAAQQPAKVYRIGYLGNTPPSGPGDPWEEAFQAGLRERGWVEGQNILIERRYSRDRNERLPSLATELVQLNIDVLVAMGTPATAAATAATTTIPIVFGLVGDPVGSGFVASLARPGKNATGYGGLIQGIHIKMLGLLKEAVPKASRIGVVWNSTLSLHVAHLKEVESGAQQLGLTSERVDVRSSKDLDGAFAVMARKRLDGLVVLGQPLITAHRTRVAKLAADHRLPSIYVFDEVVQVGGLMSYGIRIVDSVRRVPYFIDRILKGARPAEIPVEQPDRFYLVINLKTAKALGLALPLSLLLRADQVIDP